MKTLAITAPPARGATVDRLTGVLLGTAVGDAVGLPAEGLAPAVLKHRWDGVWRHRFFLGRGMVSDDTEHTLMVAQCLLEHPDDSVAFQKALARRLRWWLAALPASVGLATGRAILKLWIGFPPGRNGIWSAGNGPLMRSALIGVYFARDAARRAAFVRASTRLTHTDPRAEMAALAIAEIAAAITASPKDLAASPTAVLRNLALDTEGTTLLLRLDEAAARRATVAEFAAGLGLERGITGYAWHTAPMAIYAWWQHRGDFRGAVEAVLDCGGDTDTVAAIVGALAGAEGGVDAVPAEWIAGIHDWPRDVAWMRRVGAALQPAATTRAVPAPGYFWPGVLPRNLFFLTVILTHGFFRLIPR